MMNSKKKIDAMIREDLGISILKRFNIVFYRTFIWCYLIIIFQIVEYILWLI